MAGLSAAEFAGVRRGILRRGALVAAPIALLLSVYLALWQPRYGDYPWVSQLFSNIAQSLGYLALILLIGNVLLRRWLAPHEAWAVAGEPITAEQQNDLVRLPARSAAWIVGGNAMILVIGTVVNELSGVSQLQVAGYFFTFALIGFTFGAVVYLQSERALRVLYVRAFATSLPTRRSVGVLPRLVVTWAVGSAVPLFLLAIIPLRPATGEKFSQTVPTVVMAISGLLIGGVTTLLVARSVAEPIDSVRRGLERVRDGDIDHTVDVTQPGALGTLQAGFNSMVDAMRSRRRLEDLLGRQVGQDVARQAFAGGVELGGEIQEASVLFVDLVGSSALAERRPPAEVVAVLNRLFDAVVTEVGDHGGWVNKFEGDGCLCVFGVPALHPDHAAFALRSARLLAARLHRCHLDAAIGVSSGQVVAGNVGTLSRFEYTVIGRPVNEAARLTDAAKAEPGRVLASAAMVDAAGAEARHWQGHGTIPLRGMQEPVATAVPADGGLVTGEAVVAAAHLEQGETAAD